MRDDAPRKEVPGNGGAEEDDASRQAKAKARAAAGDHERGLAPSEEPPPDASGDSSGAVKGDPAK
jgi:hypothetical protein